MVVPVIYDNARFTGSGNVNAPMPWQSPIRETSTTLADATRLATVPWMALSQETSGRQ